MIGLNVSEFNLTFSPPYFFQTKVSPPGSLALKIGSMSLRPKALGAAPVDAPVAKPQKGSTRKRKLTKIKVANRRLSGPNTRSRKPK